MFMKKRHSIVLAPFFMSLALFCACTVEIEPSYPEGYSERCVDKVTNISKFQASFGDYDRGDVIPFKHSDGYLFNLSVSSREYSFDISCEKHLDIQLESSYPIYSFLLSGQSSSFYYNEYYKIDQSALDVQFGQYYFTLRDPETLKFFHDSLSYIGSMEINGVTYHDVAVDIGGKQGPNGFGPSEAKLYYQTKKGILKIELEDGSYIAINEGKD